MLQIHIEPERKDWERILKRPSQDNTPVLQIVKDILSNVQANGDAALLEYVAKFDKATLNSLGVSTDEIEQAATQVSSELKEAIGLAYNNISVFHTAQKEDFKAIETMPGVSCWRKSLPIEKVGLYIPGGSAPLFSTLLMLGIPAKMAGCKKIILCTPCNSEGKINAAILFTAAKLGITEIYKLGGAQAIAALAFGTETVPKVYKIFGPGNQFVTAAKSLVQQNGLAIDMPAGPSEVLVYANESSNPAFVAADLLSQAEHGPDSQVVLVCNTEKVAIAVNNALQMQIPALQRSNIAMQALAFSKAIVLQDVSKAFELINDYAAEHLIIATDDAEHVAKKVTNAGSVFLGHYSPESVGDYASGTNHTLPTNGFAKAFAGVSLDSFVKKVTYQQLTAQGLINISKAVEVMATAEGLQAHREAVTIRLTQIEKDGI